VDTSTIVQALLTLISGILGALLGLLAGRASGGTDLHRRPDDPLDDAPAD
jgi:ABC-type dipeptide/oligopeptide/nickel transport system permease subunit